MKRLSPECNTTDMLIKISEKSFCKIFEASNQTELIDE